MSRIRTLVESVKEACIDWNMQKKFMDSRVVHLMGEVDDSSAFILTKRIGLLDLQSDEDIHLVIDSTGGSVDGLFSILNAMEAARSDICTYVISRGQSAAATIASNGAKGKRYIYPYSWLMIHGNSCRHGSSASPASMLSFSNHCKKTEDDIKKIYSKNTGIAVNEIGDMMGHNNYINAKQAVRLGFMDEIAYWTPGSAKPRRAT